MNKLITSIAAGLLLAGATAAFAEGDKKPVRRERQENQQKRIKDGVQDGSLTTKEAVKLERKQGAMAQEIRQEKRDGGGLTTREKLKINAKQDKLSRDIYKQKHDGQTKR